MMHPDLSLLNSTEEVYAYCARGLSGAPVTEYGLHVTAKKDDVARPLSTWQNSVYWAVSMGGDPHYPPVLAHIYYEGKLPPQRQRDEINRAVRALTGELLFGEDSGLTGGRIE